MIISAVVDAFIAEDRTVIAHLSRVVKHNVKDYLDTVLVQLLDHVLHLVRCHPVCSRIGIRRFRREERDCGIAPVIEPLVPVEIEGLLHLIEFEYRQEFHTVDAKLLEIWDHVDNSGVCSLISGRA